MAVKSFISSLLNKKQMPESIFFDGEFGAEIILFLPFANWLSRAGLLKNTDILTFSGMTMFYEALDCRSIVERRQRRLHRRISTPMPVGLEHIYARPSPFHLFPVMRQLGTLDIAQSNEAFRDSLDAKPILIVHNKFNNEWKNPPINFINTTCLRETFERLSDQYTIVYIRHGIKDIQDGYSNDVRLRPEFDDLSLVNEFPSVFLFDDLVQDYASRFGGVSVNDFKASLYKRTFHFISTQGGGAHQCAYYSGSLLTVLHKMGREIELAYAEGYYSFLTNPAPTRAICLTDDDYVSALSLYDNPLIIDGVAQLPNRHSDVAKYLSPWKARLRWTGLTMPGTTYQVPEQLLREPDPTLSWPREVAAQ
ncbi:hypothetical protein J2X65_001283 [Ancylobacter sp. 3268]|uniref:hypothetical protein n=1 Tax=Ancylobacter sp. 3268 TaxID=2817752 RepID=UPI00285AAB5D|nr:hypothetical protein [Ancylobacter sp. 3268]MDR6951932.1 hypothetical protein [Ancylobacter sp. 3268]